MPFADGCRNEAVEQHGIVGGEIGGIRMVPGIVFYQFLVGVNPKMSVDIKFQLIDDVSAQTTQNRMICQLPCVEVECVDSSFLGTDPDTAIFLNAQAGHRER